MKKSILVAIVSLCLAFSASMPAAASASSESAPIGDGVNQTRWANVSDITLSMTYSGGAVNWRGIIQGKSNVVRIDATFTLEKLNANGKYEYVDSWTASTTTMKLDKSGSKTTAKGTYRLSVKATVTTTSGATETVTDSLVKTF